MIRALLADDQALVRDGIRMILDAQDDIEVVAEASDGLEAVRYTAREKPDVVLMDIRMPGLDGVQATKRIVDARPASGAGPRVLMLTTFGTDELVYRALQAGASGYLLKDSPRRQLLHGVRTVAEGDALLDPALTRRLVENWVSRPAPGAASSAAATVLSPREYEVFLGIAHGLSNEEIARGLFLSTTTVKTHVTHALHKLGLRDRIQAVVFAYESGLISPGGSPG